MTSLFYDTGNTSAPQPNATARLFNRVRNGWDRWQTERAIEAMPADMRKDFGWPTSDISDNAKTQQ